MKLALWFLVLGLLFGGSGMLLFGAEGLTARGRVVASSLGFVSLCLIVASFAVVPPAWWM